MKKIASMNKAEVLQILVKVAKLQEKLLNKLAQDESSHDDSDSRKVDRHKEDRTFNIVKVFHSDHGVSRKTMLAALKEINPSGFFLRTVELAPGEPSLLSNLYGPASGDPPVKGESLVRDPNDAYRRSTPFVDKPPRDTRLLTMIGNADGDDVTIFTAYGGAAAERIPSDPSLSKDPEGRERAEGFWSKHALSIAAKK